MIRVHFWEGLYGHTALSIKDLPNSDSDEDRIYISFHSGVDASKSQSYFGTQGQWCPSYKDELKRLATSPGYQKAGIGAEDIETSGTYEFVDLYNLNEEKLVEHFERIQNESPNYKLRDFNCSVVIGQCLTAGYIGILDSEGSGKNIQQAMNQLRRKMVRTDISGNILPNPYWGKSIEGSGIILKPAEMFSQYMETRKDDDLKWDELLAGGALIYLASGWQPSVVNHLALYLKDITEMKTGWTPRIE